MSLLPQRAKDSKSRDLWLLQREDENSKLWKLCCGGYHNIL